MCKYFVNILSNDIGWGGVCGYKQQGLAKITFYEFLFYKVTTLFKKVWPD